MPENIGPVRRLWVMTLLGDAASTTSTYVCSSAAKRLSTRRAAATTSPRRRLSPRRRRSRTKPARSTGSSRKWINAELSTTATLPSSSSRPSTGDPSRSVQAAILPTGHAAAAMARESKIESAGSTAGRDGQLLAVVAVEAVADLARVVRRGFRRVDGDRARRGAGRELDGALEVAGVVGRLVLHAIPAWTRAHTPMTPSSRDAAPMAWNASALHDTRCGTRSSPSTRARLFRPPGRRRPRPTRSRWRRCPGARASRRRSPPPPTTRMRAQ